MTFNLNYFLAAVALLWLPLPYLAGRDQAFSNRARVTSATMSGAFRVWQNWADLIRAAVGVYALMELSIGLEPNSTDRQLAQWIKLGIIFIGVLLQTIRVGQGIIAPLFYLTGLTMILPQPPQAAFAIFLAWVFACGVKDARFVLPLLGACLVVATYFLGRLDIIVLFNAGLIFLPVSLALLSRKRQMFVTREARVSSYQMRRYRVLKETKDTEPSPTQVSIKQPLKSRPSAAD